MKWNQCVQLVFFVCVITLALFGQRIFAQTASELQAQITSKTAEIAALEKEIAQYQGELDKVGKDKKSLNTAIATLDLQKKKLLTDIKVTETKISSANASIGELSDTILSKSELIEQQRDALIKGIQKLHSMDNKTFLEIFLSQDKVSESWREIGNLILFQKEVDDHIQTLQGVKKELITNKEKIETTKAELISLQNDRSDQKKIVDQTAAEKADLLQETKAKESNYAKLLADKVARKAQFEQDVRSFESQLKFILEPGSLPLAGSAPLIWPTDTVKITQLFGKTVAAQRLYVSGSHNGVDFGAAVGTGAKAMASGTVIGAGNTDLACPGASYGNWILIDYDNGLTSVYAHLSLVKAKAGDRVSGGQVVAYTGSTGYSTGPHLHVSLFPHNAVQVSQVPSKACSGKIYTQPVAAINAYLDPMQYWPPIQSSMIYYN